MRILRIESMFTLVLPRTIKAGFGWRKVNETVTKSFDRCFCYILDVSVDDGDKKVVRNV